MTLDAAAGRAAAGVLARAYAWSVRSVRKEHKVDAVKSLRRRDRHKTVALVAEDMSGKLMLYLVGAMVVAAPVLVVSGSIDPRLPRIAITAVALVPAAVLLAASGLVRFWATRFAWRSKRAEKPLHLGPADIEALLERGGLLAWRLGLVLGVAAGAAIAWLPAR